LFILHGQRKDSRVTKSDDHGSVTMLAQLLQQRYTKHRHNFRKLATAKERNINNDKEMF